MNIVGVGYGTECKIGYSWLQINTLNMWDSLPKGAFGMRSRSESTFISYLTKNTWVTDKSYCAVPVSIDELTEENINELKERGYKF